MLRSNQMGFTLLELAIVLCIISVLVSMVALHYSNNIAKAELATLNVLFSQMRTACGMQLSEVGDAASVNLTHFVQLNSGVADSSTLVQLPAMCGSTAVTSTSVTCALSQKTGVITYNPVGAGVSMVVSHT